MLSLNNKPKKISKEEQSEGEEEKKPVDDLVFEVGEENNLGTSGSILTGYDALLVAKMNKGYAKELLELYKDSEDGKLNNIKLHLPLMNLLGMHVNEAGLYSTDKLALPRSYLPWSDSENKVIWGQSYRGLNEQQMTLRGFGANERATLGDVSKLDGGAGKNVFQFQSNAWQSIKSDINGYSNASRSKGQYQYLPDQLTWIDNNFTSTLNGLGVKSINELTSLEAGVITAQFHNKGPVGMYEQSFGLGYWTDHPVSKFIDKSAISTEEMVSSVTGFAKVIEEYNKTSSITDITGIYKKEWATAVALAYNDGWYFSDNLLKHVDEKFLPVWNYLFPDKKIATYEEYKNMLSTRRSSSLADVIYKEKGVRLTSSDTKRIYNTSGMQDDSSFFLQSGYTRWGFMVKVTDTRSKAYKNKYPDGSDPYLVHTYDLVVAGHQISTSMYGPYAYKNLLSVGGVSVEEDVNGNPEFVDQNGKLNWMSAVGLPKTGYSEERAKIMNNAYKLIGILYGQDLNYLKDPPLTLDCSSFIYKTYHNVGYEISRENTLGMMNSKYWEWIPLSEFQPGDICIRRNSVNGGGHTFMYLGTKGSRMVTIEATDWGELSRIRTDRSKSIIYTGETKPNYVYDNKYYCYRFTGLKE